MSVRDTLRQTLFRSTAGIVAWNIIANQFNRIRLRPGSGVRLYQPENSESAARERASYLMHVWREYRRWFDARGIRLDGSRVLELGPGDTLGVPLLALAHGAIQALGLDKFAPTRDARFEAKVYRALRDLLNETQRAALDPVLTLTDTGYDIAGDRFSEIFDCALEDSPSRLPSGAFDLILSRSVLEYLKQPAKAAAALRHLLKPGGWMVHKVDARDDGLFSHHGCNPLTFLGVSETIYQAMTSHSYRPNRLRLTHYRDLLQREGFRVETFICRIVGQRGELPDAVENPVPGRDFGSEENQLLREMRPRLAPGFASLPDSDLLASGFYIVAQKQT